ncbi:hypothetical protein QKO86_gp05 [Macropodid alphaherpesvirus 2]|uniref:Uncharacterized protein n=1 Tax=Macropodid alphaherpesvirus 2 TaxID=83440 RepID=A0AAE7MLM2_9ALPH|nr:hypothetical protein QKO86_gp05 [Macropodid alphaherpesvirus 2]QOD40247.1 hypothetical protein [Macropodid alphaherpesvirus 2]WGO49696.1 hypothetical protein [Macropodid alphaherpesvirus 2]
MTSMARSVSPPKESEASLEIMEIVSLLQRGYTIPPWLGRILLIAQRGSIPHDTPQPTDSVKALLLPFQYPVKYFIAWMVGITFVMDELKPPNPPLDVTHLNQTTIRILFFLIKVITDRYSATPVTTGAHLLDAFIPWNRKAHLALSLEDYASRKDPSPKGNFLCCGSRRRGNKISKPFQREVQRPNNV